MWSSSWIRKRQKILNKLFSYICTSQAASLLADSSYNQCMRCENVADLVETRSLRTLWTFFSYLSTVYSSILYTGYWAPSCFCQPVHLRRDCESEYFNTVNCCHQVAARCHCTEHKRLFKEIGHYLTKGTDKILKYKSGTLILSNIKCTLNN